MTAIHSVAGLLSRRMPLIVRRPSSPRTTPPALQRWSEADRVWPGPARSAVRTAACCSSTRCAEIRLSALEALRTPLEDGEIRLARRDGVARYPARCQLVLAANPCPCARTNPEDCICSSLQKRRYLGKLSGPLLDRVDLRVQMHTVRAGAFTPSRRRAVGRSDPGSPRLAAPPPTLAALRILNQRRGNRGGTSSTISATGRGHVSIEGFVGTRPDQYPGPGQVAAGGVDPGRPGWTDESGC